MRQKLLMILKGQKPLIDVWHYIVGTLRYNFYYGGKLSKKYSMISYLRKKIIRKFIKEQINYRIAWMNPECYDKGSCVICGCETTALQMANKSCDLPCYPCMMDKKDWEFWKDCGVFVDKKNRIVWHKRMNGKPYIYFKA